MTNCDTMLQILKGEIMGKKVLSILLVAASVGLALALMKDSENIQVVLKGI